MLYPFAKEQLEAADRLLPEPEGDRLGPGGAAQHGRLEGDVAADARACCPRASTLTYIGRQGRASTGEGYSGAHALEQERIVLTALTPGA